MKGRMRCGDGKAMGREDLCYVFGRALELLLEGLGQLHGFVGPQEYLDHPYPA